MFAMGAWKGMIRKEYNLKNFFPLLDKLGANTKGAGGVVKEVFLQENAKNLAIRYYNQTGFFSTLRSFFHISPAKKNLGYDAQPDHARNYYACSGCFW
jgi:hypothetical protein